MKSNLRNTKDFYGGLIFIAFGILFVTVARDYPMGKAARMGPGYFPTVLGGFLAGLGLVIVGRSFFQAASVKTGWAIRPLTLVIAGIFAFALVIQPLGLVCGTLVLLVISRLAYQKFRFLEILVLFVFLSVLVVLIFFYGLGLPFKIWPV